MAALFRKKGEGANKTKKGKRSVFSIFAALVPEHFGDFFTIAVMLIIALGAFFFFQFAWLTTTQSLEGEAATQIPFFAEEELNEIVKVLEAREEASTAPVVPPTRDPFK